MRTIARKIEAVRIKLSESVRRPASEYSARISRKSHILAQLLWLFVFVRSEGLHHFMRDGDGNDEARAGKALLHIIAIELKQP
jgi:hypothetical protein